MVPLWWKRVYWFLNKLNIESPCDPSVPLLDIYLKELKTGIQTSMHTEMFIAAQSIRTNRWKQPKCPSMDKQKWCIHTMEYYSSLKRNDALTHDTIWMKLENITLSENPDTKGTYSMISLI